MPIISLERCYGDKSNIRLLDQSLNLPDKTGEHQTVLGTVNIDMSNANSNSKTPEVTVTWDKLGRYGRKGETRKVQLGGDGIGGQRLSKELWLKIQTHEPIRTPQTSKKGGERLSEKRDWDYVMGR